jgi:hypothetical protein
VAVPLPEPLLAVVIQAALLETVQVQLVPAVTVTEPLPPEYVKDADVAERVYVQGAGSWLTVTV